MTPTFQTVGIVGAGAMGRGIAQMAAQAGSAVILFDLQPNAAETARQTLAGVLAGARQYERLFAVTADDTVLVTVPLPVLWRMTVLPGFVTLVSPLELATMVLPDAGAGIVALAPGVVETIVVVPSGLMMVTTGVVTGSRGGVGSGSVTGGFLAKRL